MPLTAFQTETLRLLAARRSPESFLAGGTVPNAAPDSPRYSRDIDIFHDVEESVMINAGADAVLLQKSGYRIARLLRQPAFQRAEAARGENKLTIEWVFDSAFRFFPVERDELSGWRLNLYDAAINKMLALMSRSEPRDYLDILFFHQNHLSLGALCWAAAGKDPGVNPFMILQESQRNVHFRPEQFQDLRVAAPIDLQAWKKIWLEATRKAEQLLEHLPAGEVGCLYLDKQNHPVTPDPLSQEFASLRRHYGSVRGAWPIIRG